MFAFGRTRTTQINGRYNSIKVPKEEWAILIPDVHEFYITREEYEQNIQRLTENHQAFCTDRPKSPPREGPSLLQGVVLCGKCGKRMTVRYHTQKGDLIPDYVCQRAEIERGGEKPCQVIRGGLIDKSIGNLLIEMVTPMAIEVALAVQQEVEEHYASVQHIYQQRVEAARYEADLSRRRYRSVDPDNRLVASTLEAEWNEKLKCLEQAQTEYQEQQNTKKSVLNDKQKQDVLTLTQNFEGLWNAPETPHRERKRIIRLLIEDITLHQDKEISLQIRFKGGTVKTVILPRPKGAPEYFTTSPHIISEIDRLLDEKTEAQIATIFNEEGLLTPRGSTFTPVSIQRIRTTYNLKSRYDRLREKGWLTRQEFCKSLPLHFDTISRWQRQKKLPSEMIISEVVDERGFRLYPPLDNMHIEKLKKMKGTHACRKTSPQPSQQGAI
jgi:hypothetical protein